MSQMYGILLWYLPNPSEKPAANAIKETFMFVPYAFFLPITFLSAPQISTPCNKAGIQIEPQVIRLGKTNS